MGCPKKLRKKGFFLTGDAQFTLLQNTKGNLRIPPPQSKFKMEPSNITKIDRRAPAPNQCPGMVPKKKGAAQVRKGQKDAPEGIL